MADERKWMIAASGTEWGEPRIYSFTGTEDQVKNKLVDLVKATKNMDSGNFDDGTETINDIKEFRNPHTGEILSISAWVSFCRHPYNHDDYTAYPAETIQECPDSFY